MPHSQFASLHHFPDFRMEIEKPQHIANHSARAAHGIGSQFMSRVEFVNQALQGLRFFDGIKIFALNVLDQRHGQRRFIVHRPNHSGDFGQPRCLSGAPAPLARENLKMATVRVGTPDDGLDHN